MKILNSRTFKTSLVFALALILVWLMGKSLNAGSLGRLYMSLFPPDAPRDHPYAPWWKFAFGAAEGITSDVLLTLYALAVSVALGIFVPPLHVGGDRPGKHLSVFLTTIPYFVILVSIMYLSPDDYLILFTTLGVITSSRLLILLVNRLDDVEKDEYVLFLALSGRSRYGISLKFSTFQSMESVFPTIAWNFTTLLTFTTFLSFMGVGGLQRVSLGGFFRMLYDNFNSLAIYMRGDLGVMGGGLLRYAPGIAFFILFNYLFHEIMESARRDFLKAIGASYTVELSGRESEGKEVWKELKGLRIKRVKVVSNFTGKPIIEFEGNLNFKRGDVVLVSGESGSGKTLFVSSIAGMLKGSKLKLEADVIFEMDSGEVELKEGFGSILRSGLVEFIPQNPRESFDKYTKISTYLKDAGLYENVKKVIEERFDTHRKKASDDLDKYPSEVSDGVLQIINLAILYVRSREGGKLLILDEPTASLSYENVSKALDMMGEIFEKNVVFWIDHDPSVIMMVPFNRFLEVVPQDGVSKIREITREEYERFREKKFTVREIFGEMDGEGEEEILVFDVKKIRFPNGKCLVLDHGGRKVIRSGEVHFIVGDNGTGKTSLLKVLVGYYGNFEGDAVYLGVGDVRRKRKDVWKVVDILLQNADSSLPSYAKVSDVVGDERILEELNLSGKYSFRVYQLSYGQKKRLMLARIIERNPRLIFLDEPNASLDVENFLNIVSKLAEVVPKSRSALVIITHDGDIIPSGARRIEVRGEISCG